MALIVVIAVSAVARASAQAGYDINLLIPNDTLIKYSVYGTEYVLLPQDKSGTASGGWFGSGQDMEIGNNDIIRSPWITVGRDLILRNGVSFETSTKILVGRDLSLSDGIKGSRTIRDTVQVGRDLNVAGSGVELWYRNGAGDTIWNSHLFVQGTFRDPGNGNIFGYIHAGDVNQTGWVSGWKDSVLITSLTPVFGGSVAPAPKRVGAGPVPKPLGDPPVIANTALPGYSIPWLSPTPSTIAPLGTASHPVSLARTASRKGDTLNVSVVVCELMFPGHCNGDTLLPGDYGALTISAGTNLLLGEGFYSFNSISLSNGAGMISTQPNGEMTVVNVRGDMTTSTSSKSHVGPVDAMGVTKYGTGVGEFLGGTFLLTIGGDANLGASDNAIWATISVPNGTAAFNSQPKLFGQVFAKRVIAANNIDFGQGAYVPIRKPRVITVNKGTPLHIKERAPGQVATYRDTTIVVSIDYINAFEVKVDWKLVDAVARLGLDYTTPSGLTSGTLTIPQGQLSDSIVIRILDDMIYEGTEPFRIVLSNPQKAILPDSALTDSIEVSIDDDETPPTLHFETTSGSGLESVTPPVVRVRVSSALEDAISVSVYVVGGTASNGGIDYSLVSPYQLVFPPHTLFVDVPLTVVNDRRDEPDETVSLVLRDPVGLVALKDSIDTAFTYTIQDDDAPPALALVDTFVVEPDQGSWTTAKFVVRLVAADGTPLSAGDAPQWPLQYRWYTADSSARAADPDYDSVPRTLRTFPAGQVTDTVSVIVRGDNHFEGPEGFRVVVDSFVNLDSARSDRFASGTIRDNEGRPALRLASGGPVREPDAPATDSIAFVVTLVDSATGTALDASSAPRVPVSYTWSTRDLTARAGLDYDTTGRGRARTIGVGKLSDTVFVKVLGDDRYEGNETFLDTIVPGQNAFPAGGASILSAQGTILDDEPAPGLCIADTVIDEGSGGTTTAYVRVFLADTVLCSKPLVASQEPEVPVRFAWNTLNGSATSPADFGSVLTGSDSVRAGQLSQLVRVAIVPDLLHESNEVFQTVLGSVVNGRIAGRAATVTIRDDDAEPTILRFDDLSTPEGDSASKLWRFVVKLSSPSGLPAIFSWSTRGGLADSATDGEDFVPQATILDTIPAGQDSAILDVRVNGDTKFERDEVFGVRLAPVTGITTSGSVLLATGRILNDDSAPFLAAVAALDSLEGNAGTKTFRFVVRLSAKSGLPAVLRWSSIGDTGYFAAKAGEDFDSAVNRRVAIPAGSDSVILSVVVRGDLKHENNEVFRVVADPDTGLSGATLATTGTIVNDDSVPTVSVFDASTVLEPARFGDTVLARFKIALSAPSGLPVDVAWTTDDSSATTSTDDYVKSGNLALRFAPGIDTIVVTVPVLGDSLDEPLLESFRVLLTNAVGAIRLRDTAWGRIQDNDTAPSIHVDSATGYEPLVAGVGSNVPVRVRLQRLSGLPVTFRWSTHDNTARFAEKDYDSTGSSLATIPPGTGFIDIQVTVRGDSVANEGNETFRIVLDSLRNALGPDTSGTVTIIDRTPVPELSIASSDTVDEDSVDVPLVIALDRPSAVPVRVLVRTVGVTATAGADFRNDSVWLVIPANTRKHTQYSTLVKEDNRYESPIETYLVRLDSAVGTVDPDGAKFVVIGIRDDEPVPSLSISDNSTVEPALAGSATPATFTVSLSGPSELPISVSWTTDTVRVAGVPRASPVDDFEAVSGTLQFDPDVVSRTLQVAIYGDSLDEYDERYLVRLDSPMVAVLAKDSGIGTILDEDLPPDFTIEDPDSVAEGGLARFTVHLSRASGKDVRFAWSTLDGTAKAGLDFTGVPSNSVVMPAGKTSLILPVTTLADLLANEGTENFEIRIDSLLFANPSDTIGLGLIAEATGIPVIAIDSVGAFREPRSDSSAVFHLSLSLVSATDVKVRFRTVSGTATVGRDLADTTGVAIFPAGTTRIALPVRIVADAFHEADSEDFQVRLFSPESARIIENIGTGVILDDDPPPVVSVEDDSILEPLLFGDLDTVLVRVRLSAPSWLETRVSIRLEDSTAVSPDDYLQSGTTLVIPPESTSVVFRVAVVGDSVDEYDEAFRVLLSRPVNGTLGDSIGRVVIQDSDEPPVLVLSDASAPEGDTALVAIRLQRPSAKTIVLDWTTRDGTAMAGLDYLASGRRDTLAAGTTGIVLRIPVFSDSIANEFDETFRVLATRVVDASVPDSDAVVTVVDRTPKPFLTIHSAGTVQEDPVLLTFPLTLDRPSAVPVVVRWRSLAGTALPGLDYADTSGILIIPASTKVSSVAVRVLEDQLYEPWVESLQVVLSAPESAFIATDRASGFISDDHDNPPVVIDDAPDVAEGGSARFPIRLLGLSADTVKVWVHTVDGTAKAGSDYVGTTRVVVFRPGETVQEIPVSTLVDTLWEPSESFSVRIDFVQGGFVDSGNDSIAHVNLLEEGPFPTLEFVSRDTSVVEAVAGRVPVVVRLSRAASVPLQVGIAIDGASKATSGADYTLQDLSGDTLTLPALSRETTFHVAVLDDSLDEFDELVRLGFRVLGRPSIVGKSTLDLTILDDDEAPQIVFSVDSQIVDESVGTVFVTARLSRPSGKIIDVWYTIGGTATPGGVDHDMQPFHFTFRTGNDTARVSFKVVDDVLDEPDETVTVDLDSAVNGNLAAGQRQIVLIRDNDDAPKARFGDTLRTVREDVGTVSFPIVLDHPSASDVTVRITVRGSATLDSLHAGSDARLDSMVTYTIVIPAGDTSATFVVPVIGDGRVETTEDVVLTLKGGPGADPTNVSTSRLVILDDDRNPDVVITRPSDSLKTNQPSQLVTWTWDGRDQPHVDTTLIEGWNTITRCATDTAGNTGCDTVHVKGDFTPPKVTITVPESLYLTNKPTVHVCWTVVDSGATWRDETSRCIDTTLTEGTHTIPKTACDEVGNCGTDQVVVTVDLTPPVGQYVFPPDSSRVRVLDQPARIRWIDGKDTIWVADTLHMAHYGWNTFTATYKDKAGNVGTTSVHVYFEAPQVQDGWYVDTNGDGKIDAAIVEFDAPWVSDTLPRFSFTLGSETRTDVAPKGWYTEGTRGVPARDGSGKVIKDSKGDTVYLAAGIPMLDKTGKPVIDSTTGKVLTSPVGSVWRDASGKPVYDAQGRELYRVPGPGTADRTRMVVPLPNPFAYGVTSVTQTDTGRVSVSLPVVDSTGKPVVRTFAKTFPMSDSVAPIIAKAEVHRTETYSKDGGMDTLFLTPSEPVTLDSSGRWIEIKVGGTWIRVNPDSVFQSDDGRIWFLIPPGDSASPRPGLQVRFLEGVSDSVGNHAVVGKTTWETTVVGPPRPPLLQLTLPTPVKNVPASESNVTRPGGFVIRATDRDDPSQYSWWKPGYGYTSAMDKDIRSICPDLDYCNGPEMYVNRPVRMILFVYDLSGTYVVNQEINITQKDLDGLRADELDRVRIQLEWNMRSHDGHVVASGIYLWRIVSYVTQPDGTAPIMTNQVIKLGVKSVLD